MNRILLLVAIAAVTFAVVFFIRRPDILNNVWLWLVGLAGPIVRTIDAIVKKIRNFISPPETKEEQLRKNVNETGKPTSA